MHRTSDIPFIAEQDEQENLAPAWDQVRRTLRRELGEVNYHQWILSLELGEYDDGELTLYVPTRFYRDQMQKKNFSDRIVTLWREFLPQIVRVEYQVRENGRLTPPRAYGSDDNFKRPSAGEVQRVTTAAREELQSARDFQYRNASATGYDVERSFPPPQNTRQSKFTPVLNRNFTFDSFVVGKPNEFAYACARKVAEAPSTPGFNPLFFYGGVGLGKTHLMHAIGSELLASGNYTVAYMSAEQFLEQFINAIQAQKTNRNSMQELKDQWRSVNVLMIDDVQFLLGKSATQEEFFNTFNYLMDHGSQIIVSADKSPSDLPDLDARLRSRLCCGMVADLHAANFELRFSIVRAKAQASGVHVPEKVVEYLAQKITSSVRELEGAFNRLLTHADLFKKPITLESTQELLKDMLRANEKRITIDEIQKKVAEHWNIRLSEMTSTRRSRNVARPRQVAMYLSKELTNKSLPDIGREFKRDHTTVLHAVDKVTELMASDESFAQSVDLVRRLLETS